MYCKLALKLGATLPELKNDLVGLLTGAVTSLNQLTAANVASSELVIKEAAEWTFVQDLASTDTRQHFVLEGVEQAGIKKTMGIVLTVTSGTLNCAVWYCGPWDAVNQRPRPYDVTGKSLSPQAPPASEWANPGGTSRNTIFLSHDSASTVPSTGITLANGAGILLISSRPGNTRMTAHAGTSHQEVLEVADIPRDVAGPMFTDPAEWPYPIFWAARRLDPTGVVGCPVPNVAIRSATGNGVTLGSNGVFASLPAPYTSELGVSHASSMSSSVPGNHTALLAFVRASRTGAARFPIFSDRAVEHLLVHQASPHLNAAAPGVANVFDERQVTPVIEMLTSTNPSYPAFLDEIVVGDDVFVSPSSSGLQARCFWKG